MGRPPCDEALKELEAKWETISRTSSDKDEQAKYGNDLMVLTDTKEKVIEAAKVVYGESIATLGSSSHNPIVGAVGLYTDNLLDILESCDGMRHAARTGRSYSA